MGIVDQPFDHSRPRSLSLHLTADRGLALMHYITGRYGLEVPVSFDFPESKLLEKNFQWGARWVFWLKPFGHD